MPENMFEGMEEPAARPERGLPPEEQQSYLKKLRMTSVVDWNLKRLTQLMFEEMYVSIVIAFLAIGLGNLLQPIMEENAGSPWLIAIPLGFFTVMCILRPFETYLFWIVPSYDPVIRGGTSLRLQRLLQNVIFLAILILIQAAPPAVFNVRSDALVELELKNNLEWGSSQYLLACLSFARKFHGSCAMVTIYRIYIDLALQTSTFLVGYPPGTEEGEGKQEEYDDNGNVEGDTNANENCNLVERRGSNGNTSARPSRRRIVSQHEN